MSDKKRKAEDIEEMERKAARWDKYMAEIDAFEVDQWPTPCSYSSLCTNVTISTAEEGVIGEGWEVCEETESDPMCPICYEKHVKECDECKTQ